MLRPPEGGPGLELSSFVRPDHEPGSPTAMANELGLRNVSFEIDDLQATVDGLAADGYGLVAGIGHHENIWRMAYAGQRGSSCPWLIALVAAESWDEYSDDVERTHRALTAPGMTTLVAIAGGRPRVTTSGLLRVARSASA